MSKRISMLLFSLLAITLVANSQNTYNEITLPELMKKKKSGDNNMVIVDVRTKGEYSDTSRNKALNIGHIKGAIHLSLQDLQQNPDAVQQLEPYKNKDIYLVCSHSYRSRAASNILLKNGFAHVSNVQGGMTEWYRRYDELAPYRESFLEKGISYNNISPEELHDQLISEKKILLLGIRNTPRAWFDSFNLKLYRHYPMLKNTMYFNYADSLKILETVLNEKKPVVLFNLVNNGAAELAEWLSQKGVADVSYLVGGVNLFYEYSSNKKAGKLFSEQSKVYFITPVILCEKLNNKNIQIIDLRHDSLFNKVNSGVKHDYKHLKNAVNFFAGKGSSSFEQEFPDMKKEYVFISGNYDGLEMADALTKKSYKISWMIGGYDRLEWYMNNVENFNCNDLLVK